MTPENYAQALFELSQKSNDKESLMNSFVALLERHGAMKLLPRILLSLEKLEQKIASGEPTLTIANESQKDSILNAIEFELKEAGADKTIKTIIDDSIIGGYRLEYKGKMRDASYKNQLLSIYRNITTG